MMKNLSKSVVVSLVLILLSLCILANSVFALGGDLILNPDANGTGNGTDLGNTLGNNATVNTTVTPTVNEPATQTNVVKINEINSDKDLPQTGENDIYIISVIGLSAVVIGSVAYAKSKKYDM